MIGSSGNAVAADAEIEAVKEILKRPRVNWSRQPSQEHAEDLKRFGDKAIPLLATLLEDYWLGYEASETMMVIDPDKATPLILASIPKSDRNVQFHTFNFFIRRINEGVKIPLASDLHDAAVRCLESDTPADVAEVALIVIALTGNDSDYPLLERIYERSNPTTIWGGQLKCVSEAALARLGHEKYLKNIEAVLEVPISARIPEERAGQLDAAIMEAGFSQNPRFIPLLAKHLGDLPVEAAPSDVDGPDPAGAARIALYEIISHTSSGMDYRDIDFSKLDEWWNSNKQKFGK